MSGQKLDGAAVRKLEKMPTKQQLMQAVAIMIKKARSPLPASLGLSNFLCYFWPHSEATRLDLVGICARWPDLSYY
jgi:hypothetical protein